MERFLLQEQRRLAGQVADIKTELAVHRNLTELRLNALVSRLHSIEARPPMVLPVPKTGGAGAAQIRLKMAAVILGIVYLSGGRISEALGLIAALLSRHAT